MFSLIECYENLCLDDLNYNAQQFGYEAGRVKQKFWWQNVKVFFLHASTMDDFDKIIFLFLDVDYHYYHCRDYLDDRHR